MFRRLPFAALCTHSVCLCVGQLNNLKPSNMRRNLSDMAPFIKKSTLLNKSGYVIML